MGVFLGIATYRRPSYLVKILDAVHLHLGPLAELDEVQVVHDGPCQYQVSEGWVGVEFSWLRERGGVAAVKNDLLRRFLDSDSEWCILAEDDIVPQSHKAIVGYMRAAEGSGIEHLNFHAHGPANNGYNLGTDDSGLVTFWPNYVGAWCLTSRRAVEQVGLMDDRLYNALEHVEWTLRMGRAGFCPYPEPGHGARVADATGAERWLAEIPGSIEASSILADGGEMAQRQRTATARDIWKTKDMDTYSRVFNR